MFNAEHLLKERLSNFLKEINRYGKYILNGHMTVALMFFIVVLSVYYQKLLENLPDHFPSIIVLAMILGGVTSYQPIYTLLKEPDLVFLMPAESKMNGYFQKILAYNYFLSLIYVVFILAATSPLYFHTFPNHGAKNLVIIALVAFFMKGFHLMLTWFGLRMNRGRLLPTLHLFAILLSINFFHSLLKVHTLGMIFSLFLYFVLFLFVINRSSKYAGIPWETLIIRDRKFMYAFYRFAHLFVDVPHVQTTIKKRKILTDRVQDSMDQKYTYHYLYALTFLRSNAYFGLFIRLTIIGSLFIYFIPNEWLKVIFALLFLYLTMIQLIPLYKHHRTKVWLDLYPVQPIYRKKGFQKVLVYFGILQIAVFSVILLGSKLYLGIIIIIAGGIMLQQFFLQFYSRRETT